MREKLYEFVKSKGHFNGDIMGVDTYIIFIDSFVDELMKFLRSKMKKQVKIKYYLRLYKSNGELIRDIPCKNRYEAERQMGFYNSTSNIKADIYSIEVKK